MHTFAHFTVKLSTKYDTLTICTLPRDLGVFGRFILLFFNMCQFYQNSNNKQLKPKIVNILYFLRGILGRL